MAVTSIKVHTASGIKLLKDLIVINTRCTSVDKALYIQLSESDYLYKKAALRVQLSCSGWLSTINSTDSVNSNIEFLGGMCTSITNKLDITDPVSVPSTDHLITIFDGCRACSSCQKQYLLQLTLLLCHLWVVGLKDCVLYTLSAASGLWTSMINKRQTRWESRSLSSMYCQYTPLYTIDSRSKEYKKALRLFYQYRTLVLTWNWLAAKISDRIYLKLAAEDYSGFCIGLKKSVNYCTISSKTNTQLKVTVTLKSGQTYESQACGLNYLVLPIYNNCYMLRGTDTKGSVLSNTTYLLPSELPSPSPSQYYDITIQGNEILYIFIFPIAGKDRCVYTLSTMVKIIPCWFKDKSTYASGIPSISEYIKYRKLNMDISDSLQMAINRWLIHYLWLNLGSLYLDTTYYSTAYARYAASESSSSTLSEDTDSSIDWSLLL